MVKAWTALHGQILINLLNRRFKMSTLRQLHHVFTVYIYDRYLLKVFDMAIKMS